MNATMTRTAAISRTRAKRIRFAVSVWEGLAYRYEGEAADYLCRNDLPWSLRLDLAEWSNKQAERCQANADRIRRLFPNVA